jgi:hypothetical protein
LAQAIALSIPEHEIFWGSPAHALSMRDIGKGHIAVGRRLWQG